jgi:hypothetical protein
MFYVMDVALIQAVIMPALCFLKIVGKKATRTQVSRVLPSIFSIMQNHLARKLFYTFRRKNLMDCVTL